MTERKIRLESIPTAIQETETTLYKHKCRTCGYEWTSNVERPKVCQHCKSPYWYRRYVWKSKQGKEKI